MINIKLYSTGLLEREGIFYSKQASEISYPKDGNDNCFFIENNSFWFNHRNNCILKVVKIFCPNYLFFDIGGGNGFVASGLEKNGIETVLIEPGIQGCLNAQKRNLKNIICSTFENASFKNNSIPSIGLFDVIEHIENDTEFLKSIHRILIKDGYVFITVPAYNALWSNDDKEAGHYRRYILKELENKLKNVGFSIEYSTYIFSILIIPIFIFRTIPCKIGLNRKIKDIDKQINEHKRKKGIIEKILNKFWKIELNRISTAKKIPFGGSCLIVVKKV